MDKIDHIFCYAGDFIFFGEISRINVGINFALNCALDIVLSTVPNVYCVAGVVS